MIQHKVLGLHQIRYGVDLFAYDLAWNTAGGAGLVAGLILVFAKARPASAGLERQ